MGISVDISKKLGDFRLQAAFTEESRRIGILGASGSGKSLTLRSIAGLEQPDEGRILLGDRCLFDTGKRINLRPQLRSVGYLFQNYALFPTMTVYQNIGAGLHIGRHGTGTGQALTREQKDVRIREMIRKFRLDGLEGRFPSELSGGQQQRTALARIMAYRPDMILLDEPFSALDAYLRDHMQEELMELLEDYDGTVILVSHNRDEIYRCCESLVILDQGRVSNYGNTRRIFAAPETRAAAILTGCKNLSRARRLDDHTVQALDWGITLRVEHPLPGEFQWIGYRAHEFQPIWGAREANCIRFRLSSRADLPFEKIFYLMPERETWDREAMLTWFVQRELWEVLEERGMPDYVRFCERDMLFLKE